MKRKLNYIPAVLLGAVLLGGFACNSSQRQQIAQAAQDAATILHGFESGEVAAYNQGKTCLASGMSGCIVIPDSDHLFIQQSMVTIGTAEKAMHSCIRTATSTAGAVACVNTLVSTIDVINADGGLHLKSPQAKTDFQLAMIGARTALTVIVTVVGGKP
jgi:hypothetical protein